MLGFGYRRGCGLFTPPVFLAQTIPVVSGVETIFGPVGQMTIPVAADVQCSFGSSVQTPLEIFGASLLKSWIRADSYTPGATAQANDQSGNGNHWTVATANAPTVTATDATLNNQPTFQFSGTQWLDCAYGAVAPGTTPLIRFAVMKIVTSALNRVLIGGVTSARLQLYIGVAGTPPTLRHSNTTASHDNQGGGAVGNWFRAREQFSNSASDYLLVKGTLSALSNAGNGTGNGQRVGAGSGASPTGTIMACAEVGCLNAVPTAPQLTALEAYFTSRYGAGILS